MKDYRWHIGILGVCLAVLLLSHVWVVRWDMTDDKHYSLSEASKTLLRQTDAPIEVTLLLGGDLNAGFRRLKKATEEIVEEMGIYAQFTIHNSQFKVIRLDFGLLSFMSGNRTVRRLRRPFILMR